MLHHNWPDIVPSDIQQDPIAYPFQRLQFATINPQFPVPPTPSWQPEVCSPSPLYLHFLLPETTENTNMFVWGFLLFVWLVFVFGFVLFCFCFFKASRVTYGSSQPRGLNQSCSCWPMPQPQQCWIWVTSVTYTSAHGNAGSLIHWVRPGMEPTSSWILVMFVTTEPQWEVLGISLSSPYEEIWHLVCEDTSVGSLGFMEALLGKTTANIGWVQKDFCLNGSATFFYQVCKYELVQFYWNKSYRQWYKNYKCNLHCQNFHNCLFNVVVGLHQMSFVGMMTFS